MGHIKTNTVAFARWTFLLIAAIAVITGSCIENYLPPEISGGENFLVVDGFLNTAGPTTFRLSRTQNLTDPERPLMETRAVVTVEGERGGLFPLNETETGVYTLPATSFRPDERHRLRIRTTNGKEYLSEFVEIKKTPPVESVDWAAGDEGVQISVTTRDPENNTRYYRWEFEETWSFTPAFGVIFILNRNVPEPVGENIYNCWKSAVARNIILGTSARLSEDYIYQYPLVRLAPDSEKHQIRYSILVKQMALTKEGFDYWQNLRRNTETLGSLFDAQPSQLTSNIRAVNNPGDLAFGFFSAYSVEEKRIFIGRAELPPWRRITGYEFCETKGLAIQDFPPGYFNDKQIYVIEEIRDFFGNVAGYITAEQFCLDCRLNGTNKKPSFW